MPVGIAEIASATPARNTSSKSWSLIAAQDEHRDEREAGQAGDDHGQPVELLLQRRLVGLGAIEQVGDAAHLGVHAGAGHDQLATTAGDRSVHERHAVTVAEGHVRLGCRVGRLGGGDALAGQRGLFDLERRGHEESAVGRDAVARLDEHDVARYQLGSPRPPRRRRRGAPARCSSSSAATRPGWLRPWPPGACPTPR